MLKALVPDRSSRQTHVPANQSDESKPGQEPPRCRRVGPSPHLSAALTTVSVEWFQEVLQQRVKGPWARHVDRYRLRREGDPTDAR